MLEKKTLKYHIPQKGVYLYAHLEEGKNEMIVLNTTNEEQTVLPEHYNVLTKDLKSGRDILSGKELDFTQELTVAPRRSLLVEF